MAAFGLLHLLALGLLAAVATAAVRTQPPTLFSLLCWLVGACELTSGAVVCTALYTTHHPIGSAVAHISVLDYGQFLGQKRALWARPHSAAEHRGPIRRRRNRLHGAAGHPSVQRQRRAGVAAIQL
jgi:hypothetical protein